MRLSVSIVAILAATLVSAEEPVRVALAVDKSVRPVMRPLQTEVAVTENKEDFGSWLKGFRTRALEAGVSASILDKALRGVRYDPFVVKRDRNQSEFTKTIWDYLDTAVSEARVVNGRKAVSRYSDTLDRIEATYGVDKDIVAAIWGLESAYGAFRGNDSTVNSLATLAFDPRRSTFFEEQLLAAMQILNAGQVSVSNMKGSWAGAMGHTQFMPTSFQKYAVDFTGDGKRDIWSDNPTDALASTAFYLKEHGWVTGQPWGVEVRLPKGFDYATARRELTKLPSEWPRLAFWTSRGAQCLITVGHRSCCRVGIRVWHS